MKTGDELTIDPLFVGLTRPATIMGVPIIASVLELITVAIIFIAIGNPLYMLILIPSHFVLFTVTANNPMVFHSMYLWSKTIDKCRKNKNLWGNPSISPLKQKEWTD